MEKHQYFNGLKFTRDEKTGYYLNSTIRKRIHRYVWEHYNGEIPEGYHIHHKDGDKSNNSIENLVLWTPQKHAAFHGNEYAKNNYDKMIENLNENARPKAAEWHRSEEGRKWHSQHAKKVNESLEKKIYICRQCGTEYEAKPNGRKKFCSNKCRAKDRRESGVDNVKRTCKKCNNEFVVNKYSKTVFCSKSCNKKHYWDNRKR